MNTRLRSAPHSGVLVIRLESDDGYPRLERAVMIELAHQMMVLARDPAFSGAVITGTEKSFASGAEIAELATLTPAEAVDFSRLGQSVLRAIENSTKPIVAAICGYCMGGGLDLALACHARIAAPDAVFAHPGGALGVLTGWGGTQLLPRLVGRARAAEMLATGRRITADEALDWGLVARILPASDIFRQAMQVAGKSRPRT